MGRETGLHQEFGVVKWEFTAKEQRGSVDGGFLRGNTRSEGNSVSTDLTRSLLKAVLGDQTSPGGWRGRNLTRNQDGVWSDTEVGFCKRLVELGALGRKWFSAGCDFKHEES